MVQHLDDSENKEVLQDEDERDLNAWTERAVTKDEAKPFKRQIVWFNLLGFLALHLATVYGFYLLFFHTKLYTFLWSVFISLLVAMGVQVGAHRLYSHRSFKAKAPLRLALVLFHTIAGQNCLWVWVRDHRQHHKYSDTDADPHNASNGFFFSHIGWLMSRKHPDVIAKGKSIDMSDLEADPFVMFQKKHYKILYLLLALGLPTVVPCWLWGEDPFISFMTAYLGRSVILLNLSWMVNSTAHKFGDRPYTKNILAVDCKPMAWTAFGEGYHNYHHTFPWDYKAAEAGQPLNMGACLIEAAARRGWAYDLRSVSQEVVDSRALDCGDGSHPLAKERQVNRTEPKLAEREHNM